MISGSGFGQTQGSSAVFFNGATATITGWSDTQITASVPNSATTGPVSVVVGNITGQGPKFSIQFGAQLTDSLGNQTSYSSSIAGGQWSFTDAQGSGCSSCTTRGTVHNQYDSKGNVAFTADALGNTTNYGYDSSNNLTSQFSQLGPDTAATTQYTYNSFGEVLTVKDALGNTTTNAYDTKGNLTSVTTPAPNGNTAASVTQFTYNSLGELTQITDPLNHVTTLTYTAGGPDAILFFGFGALIGHQDTTLLIHRRVEWNRSAGAPPSVWEGGSWGVFPRLGFVMPIGLKRIYGRRHLHFITFSCYRRLPLLKTVHARDVFVRELARVRAEYEFFLVGYVVMPEHVHLLVSEPRKGTPSTVLQMLKQRVSKKLRKNQRRNFVGQLRLAFPDLVENIRSFWQARFYDFNVYTNRKKREKLDYMHRNPLARGLVKHPKDWRWSSWPFCGMREPGLVGIDIIP